MINIFRNTLTGKARFRPAKSQIVGIMESLLEVTLADAEALVKLQNAAGNGYRIQFVRSGTAATSDVHCAG